jgi:alkylation response protein AidB-like acyl-CoA dehydrogenase
MEEQVVAQQRGIVPYRRDAMGVGLAALNKLAASTVIDRIGMRKPTERAVYRATRSGYRAVGALNRGFRTVQAAGRPSRLPSAPRTDLFDLTPTEDQQMLVGVVRELAADVLRPAASLADGECVTAKEVLAQAAELGLGQVQLPEEMGGILPERATTTGVLVAEALAHGDMGQALACLAPSSVATALTLWGDATQQQTYLPPFGQPDAPVSALAIQEPHALFDPFSLRTTAHRDAAGFVISGEKSLVVRGIEAELFLVAAQLDGVGPALFLIESSADGLTLEAEPAMGVRAANLSRLRLDDVRLPARALLADGAADVYRECVRLSRLAWCALGAGTSQAVLDYVVPYVKERQAFGEPIAYRQGVAFMVADIGTELEGLRLATYRAAARAESGLDIAREVALARRLAGEYGMRIGTDGVQLLGGHGFVKEHPVERWYRDLRAVGLMEGALLV